MDFVFDSVRKSTVFVTTRVRFETESVTQELVQLSGMGIMPGIGPLQITGASVPQDAPDKGPEASPCTAGAGSKETTQSFSSMRLISW